MLTRRKTEVDRLQTEKPELFGNNALNILTGQMMYEEFKTEQLMGESDYAPFNEAMCVNPVTERVFDQEFIETRASGHQESIENYRKKVIDPLDNLFNKAYEWIVLWFGEDMFCQINLLTLLSYLEQSGYESKVYVNSFNEDEFNVEQTELKMGNYHSIYKEVMIDHRKPSIELSPVMDQAIDLYLEMLKEENAVTKYILDHKDLPTSELVKRLLSLFPSIGYGDTQYIELIDKTK